MTDNANVTPFPTPKKLLAERYRAAYERSEHGRSEWIAAVLEMAAALAEARDQFPNDYQFSLWIAESGLGFHNDHDRAALISMHRNREIAEIVLSETARMSLRLIWEEEIKPRVGSAAKPPFDGMPEAETPQSEPVAEKSSELPPSNAPSDNDMQPTSKGSPWYGWPRADEVTNVYFNARSRVVIGKALKKRGGKEIWSLILGAVDAGFLIKTNASFTKPTARILFPCGDRNYCTRFDLGKVDDRQQVRDRIMPAVLANREAVLAAPEQMESIVAAYWQQQQTAARASVIQQRVTDALRSMPADQREIKMFGVTLWPCVDQVGAPYDYDQLCTAIWYFRDLDGWVYGGNSGGTHGSRAIIARLSTRWPLEYLDRAYDVEARAKMKRVYQLVHHLARLLEQNPDGECIVPPTPKIEGQW